MPSKFSVLLSIYIKERSEYLKRSLQSIWDDQTLRPTEIIIVKDGPLTQELETILSDFAAKAPVKFVVNQTNMGLAYALNRGIEISTCDLIARMDTDDISLPERFEKQVAFMDANPQTDICGSYAIEIDENDDAFSNKLMPVSHSDCEKFERKRDCMIHPAVMFHKSYFEKAGLYPEDTYWDQDTIMWAKGFKAGCVFANIPEYLLQFRVDSKFWLRRRGTARAKSVLKARLFVCKMLHLGLMPVCYAYLLAATKLMPPWLLKVLYKIAR